jgi:hypothetical protein
MSCHTDKGTDEGVHDFGFNVVLNAHHNSDGREYATQAAFLSTHLLILGRKLDGFKNNAIVLI